MVKAVRERYNEEFTDEKYAEFLNDINTAFNYKIHFRVAETPVFFPASFRKTLEEAGESIIKTLLRDDYKKLTEKAVPEGLFVPNEDDHSLFLALDFAVCKDENGELNPQLIELQGFPSLFGFQDFIQAKYKEHFYCPENYSAFFGDMDSPKYRERFKNALLNGHDPKHVILLEINPYEQSTSIDFVVTEDMTGVKPVNITDVIKEGRKLYYLLNGEKTEIKRIYNRVIFDEFVGKQKELNCQFHLTEDVDVEWAGHPNWFFRVSKYVMPFLDSPYVPECRFLNEVKEIPTDLENYVLKPLFSFSGTGVKFHVKREDIDEIPQDKRSGFLLQRKVKYEPVVQAPDGEVKVEVRLLYFWEPANEKPELMVNLLRLSRGEMIGVKFNKDKTWVGGTVGYFER